MHPLELHWNKLLELRRLVLVLLLNMTKAVRPLVITKQIEQLVIEQLSVQLVIGQLIILQVIEPSLVEAKVIQ